MNSVTFEALWQEINNQALLFSDTPCQNQFSNLEYALSHVQPCGHQEYCFAVWCGTQSEPANRFVDEYINRRSGKPSQQADHTVFNLSRWCVPESFQLLVYWEQFQALMKELSTVGSCAKASKILAEIVRREDADIYLQSILNVKWKDSLWTSELHLIQETIKQGYPRSRQYAWCSTIVERAITKSSIR